MDKILQTFIRQYENNMSVYWYYTVSWLYFPINRTISLFQIDQNMRWKYWFCFLIPDEFLILFRIVIKFFWWSFMCVPMCSLRHYDFHLMPKMMKLSLKWNLVLDHSKKIIVLPSSFEPIDASKYTETILYKFFFNLNSFIQKNWIFCKNSVFNRDFHLYLNYFAYIALHILVKIYLGPEKFESPM